MLRSLHKWCLILILPLLWITGTALSPKPAFHPFYIGVTEINHNAADKTLEVSCKVFMEDLEEVLKKTSRKTVDLSNAAQQQQNEALVNQYFQQHLRILVGGKPAALKFIGFEKEAESVYAYFESAGVPAVKKLDIENSILHDFTPEQINIMHVTVGGQRKSNKLNFPAHSASFQF
ncbi:hypothetical protein SAMN05444008_106170 [Cnuella takakiae]|uniref:Uncharacterized protein n=1 Tax=Cnuella takakiae TaxID=1302690 RepID=A0A1M5AAE0_9BACT|nr:DUF6702 family protein [Cnuella takakiae]OLY92046.1 hypothetical protein BUE76_09165 [Cnuella takakiae]SHF26852.1 hypothetical protein SAMN05444008_106170 [Cnuella takakiae]